MRQGDIPAADMASTFNCGIGMIAVVAAADASEAARMFTETGSPAMVIGEIVARASGDPAVELTGLDEAWRV